ncbi:phage integrase family protein [Azohydromonas caseinilytica]|uniref:Tyrosine-type recombinase/integrase n=1 Tax=Azohydromonas caseinilytica TaxID=2728836 RepID=A0A848FF54_9BURK|nr:phage integrase family protein [Azohydromonas caseinilytica]NML18014.1 tyrosine-type recombinase/integrase [Azohydromonas caseinilytica]
MTRQDAAEGAGRATAARARKLHGGHFAFMRALVQGLDLRASWDRYLRAEGESGDARAVRSTIAWLRDEFAAAARREQRPGVARLVQLDTSRLFEASALPSLEAFAAQRGLEGFSEQEQLQAYAMAFGPQQRRLKRRARLVEKQLQALHWLEGLVAQPPQAGDAVAAWLNPLLACKLEAADLFTLQQLVERINGLGQGWFTAIRGIGETKAQRIVEWLRAHEASTGLRLGAHVGRRRSQLPAQALQAVVAPATAIRPLEKIVMPAELDGRQGLYRRPQAQCLLSATNDYEALWAWLNAKQALTAEQQRAMAARRRSRGEGAPLSKALSHTQRAYRKEAERFLLWALLVRGKPLSSMTQEDCVAYREFLADPQPRSRWCGPRGRERWSPAWRPFEGPLSLRAVAQAITILRNLYAFLVHQNYLVGNPWMGVSVPRHAEPRVNAGRSLSLAQWAFVREQLAQQPDNGSTRRLRAALLLLYATGLRLSEAVAARAGDLQWLEFPPGAEDGDDAESLAGWVLRVVGKGQRLREVPVPIPVAQELLDYLASRGLVPDPAHPDTGQAFLLGLASDAVERAPRLMRAAFDPAAGIAPNTLYDQLKTYFGHCARVLEAQGDTRGAQRLAAASTHWLRHSHASHSIASGTPIEVAQQNLGHASLATTTVYVTTEQRRRMKAMNRFWKG